MALVDLGRSLYGRATEWLGGNPIVFHHAPKCGGTSVGRALRRAYLLSQGTVTPAESQKAFDAVQDGSRPGSHVSELREMMLLYMLYSGTRCVSAHIPFSNTAFDRFADKYRFVTILRHPVDRFISNYHWSHRHPGGVAHIPETLEEYVGTDRARQMGATYARYFCGKPGAEFSSAHVDAAVANLRRMHLVGFLDQVGEFQKALQALTGRGIRIGKENVGSGGGREAIMAGPLGKQITDACAVDLAVWDAVQDLRARAVQGSPG